MRRAIVLAALLVVAARSGAAAERDPLAGLALEDVAGHGRTLDELAGSPVLLVVADRRASEQADAWGERLAPRAPALVAWREPGKVAWISIVDGRGVPEYARDAARDRIRERQAGAERAARSSTLIDWDGVLAQRLGAERGRALLVLLSSDHVSFARAGGDPADDAVDRLVEAIGSVLPR